MAPRKIKLEKKEAENEAENEKPKKGRRIITLETKKEIIRQKESGLRITDLGRMYGMNKSTIATIIGMKESIMAANVASGPSLVYVIKGARTTIHDEMEKLLLSWIQMKRDKITNEMICEKARSIYKELSKDRPRSSTQQDEEFKASRGWFERFKKRTQIHLHDVFRPGEAESADLKAAEQFSKDFQELVAREGYHPQQIFSADETRLFWKRMPNRSYITVEAKKLAGVKHIKDRVTLLLGANVSGDMKLKPLLIYRTENPIAFRNRNISKSSLPVFWRSNTKACVTQPIFKDWVMDIFAPSVKKFLKERDLPTRCILLLNNAPGHPKDLETYLETAFPWIKVIYLPPNVTSLLQPMDQNVVKTFRQLYTRALFRMCFEANRFGTVDTMTEFWKKGFDIYDGVRLVGKAWSEVSHKCLVSAWKNVCPVFVYGEAAELETEDEGEQLIQEIVSTAKDLEMDINEEDVEDLIEEHADELTAEELHTLFQETQEEEKKEFSFQSDQDKGTVQTEAIREHLEMWEKVKAFVLQWHPQEVPASRHVNLFNDNAMVHFRHLLRKRDQQETLDSFFSPTSAKRVKEEPEEVPAEWLIIRGPPAESDNEEDS